MARPTGWDILGLDGDPTPGLVETVQGLAKQFGDFAHDVESAYSSLNSFGADTTAMEWVGQTAEAFKGQFGPLPARLQKLYISYSEASDALSAYAPKLQAAQSKADSALRQAQDANVDLQRATSSASNAAADLKTAQQNHAANPNPQTLSDAQTAHDTAQAGLKNAQARMDALKAQAHQAHDDLDTAAKDCAKALHHAQHDGIHNKHWWQHVGEALSEWGGKIAEIANDIAPVLDALAMATVWIPGVDLVTGALAEADNTVAMFATELKETGDAMQGHFGDALMDAGMVGVGLFGGKALGKLGGKVLSKLGREAEGGAVDTAKAEARAAERDGGNVENETTDRGEENRVGEDARKAEGNQNADTHADPVDVVSGWMLTDTTDLELPGILPIVLRRAYASGYTTGHLFGPGWSSTLDQRISINDAGIHFAGDDNQQLDYPLPSGGEEVLPELGNRWPLTWERLSDEILIYDPWSGHTRHFGTVHYRNDMGQIRDLTAISDRNGTRIAILRDEHGLPTMVEHPGYRLAVDTIATTAGPRVSGLRLLSSGDADAETVVKQFRYDGRGRLTGVVNSSGLPFTYEWDDSDRICAWQNRAGHRYSYIYDDIGRVIRGEGAFLTATFDYDPANRTTVVTNSLGRATTVVYDDLGHVVSETDALGRTTTRETDRYGRVLSRIDALGAATRYERDEAGDVRRVIEHDGSVSEFEYNQFHQIVRATAVDGAEWRRQYDDRGNLLSVTDPSNAITSFSYHADGSLAQVVTPLGAASQFATNAAGLSVGSVDPVGGQTRAVRDAAGRVVQVTNALGAITTFEWSTEGLPIARTEPDGAVTRRRYDADGRLLQVMEPRGAITTFEPGPMETLITRTGPDGVRHVYSHDSETNLLAVANPTGAQWTYQYDPAGQLIRETDFIGRTQFYKYDAAGRLTARTNGMGQRITMRHDAAGRVVAHHTPDGDYEYSYDTGGRLMAAAGPGSTLAFEYDGLGRIVAETVDDRTTQYAYDAAGRLLQRITSSGAESTWTYDAAGRPIGLEAGSGRLGFAFDAAGRETKRVVGAGAWLNREYDVVGRPVAEHMWIGDSQAGDDLASSALASAGPASQPVLSRSWVWQADGVPEEVRDNLRGVRRFTSDAAGRIIAVSARDWGETYAYDDFGNVIGADTANPTDYGQINDRTLVRQSRRTSHEYDAAGRLFRTVRRTLDGRSRAWEYTWDSRDRLIRAVTPDRGTWHYTYDPMGRRTSKQRVADTGEIVEKTTFTWDGPRIAEQHALNSDGTWVSLTWDYDPDTFRPAAQRRRSWADDADQSHIDEMFHAITTDLVGTPTELITTDGRVAWYTTTSVWGRTIAASADSGVDCPLRFPGQYHDAETGLHYNQHRYYSPDLSSYISPDPLGLAPASNDRAYVPNPLTFSDPFGLEYEKQWVPDENYSTEEIAARRAKNAAFYADQDEYNKVPTDIHDLVAAYRANPSMPPRYNPDGSIDYFRGNDLSPRGRSFWQSWIHNPGVGQTGAKIYWNQVPRSQARIMVHPTSGQIAWFPRTGNGNVHIYGSPTLYKW